MDYSYLNMQKEFDVKIRNKNKNESFLSSIKSFPAYDSEILKTPVNQRNNFPSNLYCKNINDFSQKSINQQQELTISSNCFDVIAKNNNNIGNTLSERNEYSSPLVKNGTLVMNFPKDSKKTNQENEDRFSKLSQKNNSIDNNPKQEYIYQGPVKNKNIESYNEYQLKYYKNNNEFLRSIDVNKRNVLMNFLRPLNNKK